MTPQELTRLIEEDIASNRDAFHWYGRPFRDCLREPRKIRVLDSFRNDEPEDLWLVFEEASGEEQGYKVVYHESLGAFGLAVAGTPEPVLIGFYGGFVDTLNAM